MKRILFAALLFSSFAFAQNDVPPPPNVLAIPTAAAPVWRKLARSEQNVYAGRSHNLELSFENVTNVRVVVDSSLPSVVFVMADETSFFCRGPETPATHSDLNCVVHGDAVIKVFDSRGFKEFARAGIATQTGAIKPIIDAIAPNATRIAVFRK